MYTDFKLDYLNCPVACAILEYLNSASETVSSYILIAFLYLKKKVKVTST
jgi:hypothetical protein